LGAAGGEHAYQAAVGLLQADTVFFTVLGQAVQALGVALHVGEFQQRMVGAGLAQNGVEHAPRHGQLAQQGAQRLVQQAV
jgi:hypothetical protein